MKDSNNYGGQGGGSGEGPGGICRCPNCGYSESHQRGIPCNRKICPRCGNPMVRN